MTDTNERRDDFAETKAEAKFWHGQIEQASKHEGPWRKRGEKINERYRDEGSRNAEWRYSMLWANTQLNVAALIGQIPEAEVSRRWVTDNAVVRDGAEVMEKAIKSAMDDRSQARQIRDAVLEACLPGRGVIRVRYNAEFEQVEIPQPPIMADPMDSTMMSPLLDPMDPLIEERKVHERVYFQRVYWQDYRESPARSQDDVWWRAYRDTTMDRDALVEEFGEDLGKKIPLQIKGQHGEAHGNQDGTTDSSALPSAFGRAEVWEIWDKKKKKIVWIAKGYDKIIRKDDPPLRFEGFFDCAAPLVLYRTTDNNIPLAEYTFYQDMALEIDTLQARLANIVSVLRVGGFYHAILKDFPHLRDMTDGQFYPTSEESMFALGDGNPGIDRLIATIPIEKWAAVIPILTNRVEQLKAAIFEITGFSDLMRGQTAASETLGAQNLKAQFGSYRLLPKQRVVQAWLEETYNLVGEIVAEMFDGETLTKITGVGEIAPPPPFEQQEMPEEMQPQIPDGVHPQQAEMAMQQANAQFQQQAYAQYELQVAEQQEAQQAHYDEVIAFLRDQQMRGYRVNVELDELARPDRAAMQEQASTFMQGSSQFIQSLGMVPKEMVPAFLAAYKTWARNFKLGKEVEELLDKAIEGIVPAMEQQQEQQAAQAAQPSPDVALKAQTDGQIAQLRAQVDLEIEQIRKQAKEDGEAMKAELQMALAALGNGGGNDVQHHEDDGVDMDTVVKATTDVEKARLKDEGDTKRALIKERAATEREMMKAGVATRGQDMSADTAERGKMMDVSAKIAQSALKPAPGGNGRSG